MTKMICNKADNCWIDCQEKKPHELEIACRVECDWGGKFIPLPDKPESKES